MKIGLMAAILLALSPVILIVAILLLFRKPLLIAAPITFAFTLLLTYFVWQMQPAYILGSTLKGILIGMDIALIIFGAIFFLEFIEKTRLLSAIEYYLAKLSPDKRIQAIIIAWLFGSFIEGSAGFGTPAAIVAPFLVGIGFSPLLAVIIALIGNSTSVVFGAVGTPIRIGLAGLPSENVAVAAASINLFLGAIVPVMILSAVVLLSKKKSWRAILECLPFAVYAGFAFTLPYYLLARFGQEFPSLLGSLIGLALVSITTRYGFLIPKQVWHLGRERKLKKPKVPFWKAVLPYAVLSLFLVIGKFVLGSFSFPLNGSLTHSFNLFNPGILFILTVLLVDIAYAAHAKVVKLAAVKAGKILLKPFVVIFFITAFVQLMIHSGNNISGMESMIAIIASIANTTLLPLLAPFIGGFGAFMAGSTTVSTLLFGKFQYLAAQGLGMDTAKILALQLIGASAGNMISLSNIVAAQATVGLHHQEEKILKVNIIPSLIYILLAGVVGLILIYF